MKQSRKKIKILHYSAINNNNNNTKIYNAHIVKH